jgi:hypothetical protein
LSVGAPSSTPKKRGDERGERQQQHERQVDAELGRREQRIAVGSDGEKRHVAQIEQSRVADHDIQAQREHDEQQRHVDDAHPGSAQHRVHDERQRDENGCDQNVADGPRGGVAKELVSHGGALG